MYNAGGRCARAASMPRAVAVLHAVGQRRAVRRLGREERGRAAPHSRGVLAVAAAIASHSRIGGRVVGTSTPCAGGRQGRGPSRVL